MKQLEEKDDEDPFADDPSTALSCEDGKAEREKKLQAAQAAEFKLDSAVCKFTNRF